MLFQVLFLVYIVLDFLICISDVLDCKIGLYWASVIIKKNKKKINFIKIQGSMIIVLATWLEISLARPTFHGLMGTY